MSRHVTTSVTFGFAGGLTVSILILLFIHPHFQEGDQLKVVYNDGRGTVDYIYYDTLNSFGFKDSEGNYISERDISRNDTQEEHPWTPGGENSFDIGFLGKNVSVPVNVVPSKVKAISFTPKKPYTFIDGSLSSWIDLDVMAMYNKGDVLTVTYACVTTRVPVSIIENPVKEIA